MIVYNFSMQLSVADCEHYYLGNIRYVVVTADNGETVQLPAGRFRRFITTTGIRGRFRLVLDNDHKFVSLEKTY